MNNYVRFFTMICTSTLIMYAAMYLNTYAFNHIFWSETRAYMSLIMGAIMTLVMFFFMKSMYKNKLVNLGIICGSSVLFASALYLVRSQTTVADVSYMRAMIPHHSIAILTSERANISDPRVRNLADKIIQAQKNEIGEMKYLIHDIQSNK